MTNILLIVLGMAVAGLAVLFAIENASVVSLSILEFRSRQLPLFVWLAVAFLAGLALGLVVATRVFSGRKVVNENSESLSLPIVKSCLICGKIQFSSSVIRPISDNNAWVWVTC